MHSTGGLVSLDIILNNLHTLPVRSSLQNTPPLHRSRLPRSLRLISYLTYCSYIYCLPKHSYVLLTGHRDFHVGVAGFALYFATRCWRVDLPTTSLGKLTFKLVILDNNLIGIVYSSIWRLPYLVRGFIVC